MKRTKKTYIKTGEKVTLLLLVYSNLNEVASIPGYRGMLRILSRGQRRRRRRNASKLINKLSVLACAPLNDIGYIYIYIGYVEVTPSVPIVLQNFQLMWMVFGLLVEHVYLIKTFLMRLIIAHRTDLCGLLA